MTSCTIEDAILKDLRSTRIVKEPGNNPGDDSGAAGGSKVRRKEVSPFNDSTESAMLAEDKCKTMSAKRTTMQRRRKTCEERETRQQGTAMPCQSVMPLSMMIMGVRHRLGTAAEANALEG